MLAAGEKLLGGLGGQALKLRLDDLTPGTAFGGRAGLTAHTAGASDRTGARLPTSPHVCVEGGLGIGFLFPAAAGPQGRHREDRNPSAHEEISVATLRLLSGQAGRRKTDCISVFLLLLLLPMRVPALGELELAVLDWLWTHGEGDVKLVHEGLGRDIMPNTVQSTLKRLNEKGFLRREKVSHAFFYSPAMSRAAFHRQMLGEVVEDLLEGQPEAVLAAFVDLAERAGPENLARLERMIAARRGEQR